MKLRLKYLSCFLVIFIALFAVMKIAFMLCNIGEHRVGISDIAAVIWHGLPLDLSTACYLTILPWLISLVSVFVGGRALGYITKIYCVVIAPLLSVIFVADIALYPFWQFKLDATIFNYIDSPKNAAASVSVWFIIIALVCITIITAAQLFAFRCVWQMAFALGKTKSAGFIRQIVEAFSIILAGGIMFLLIRGGVGRSTMNVGRVYFSQDQYLNHSAVNPAFSLLSSSFKTQNLDKLYRYYSRSECDSIFAQMGYSTHSITPDTLLKAVRPNIVLIIMEGCGASFVEAVGGKAGITPNLNKLAKEGVLFTNCYANSFRTDRGLVNILSGYPAFPTLSVMKMPDKARSLPSLAASLAKNDYSTSFLYGGDINFTQTKGYLLATGFGQARGYETFPLSVRHQHSWGVNDHITLDTLYNIICREEKMSRANGKNYFVSCLTLSSHEDWQVPFHKIPNDEVANSMAYLDNCIGRLVSRLKKTSAWSDMLVILVPDHGISYPRDITEANPERNHIPMLWIGGALAQPRQIEVLCNNTDLVATLLGQLHINHDDFTFSRDVLSHDYTYPIAVHTFSNGITLIDSTGFTVEDLNSHDIINERGEGAHRTALSHAYLQKIIEDLAAR